LPPGIFFERAAEHTGFRFLSLGGAHKIFFSPWAADVGRFTAGISSFRMLFQIAQRANLSPRTETGMLFLDPSIARAQI
jgi:hypothetical protein